MKWKIREYEIIQSNNKWKETWTLYVRRYSFRIEPSIIHLIHLTKWCTSLPTTNTTTKNTDYNINIIYFEYEISPFSLGYPRSNEELKDINPTQILFIPWCKFTYRELSLDIKYAIYNSYICENKPIAWRL